MVKLPAAMVWDGFATHDHGLTAIDIEGVGGLVDLVVEQSRAWR
jgi:hypothetical protein